MRRAAPSGVPTRAPTSVGVQPCQKPLYWAAFEHRQKLTPSKQRGSLGVSLWRRHSALQRHLGG